MEAAKSVISTMGLSGVIIGARTYTTLLCCYARIGDIDSITNTLHECKDKEIMLCDIDILKVIYELSIHGYGEHIEILINQLRMTIGYHQNATNTMLSLITQNQIDDAYKILQTLPHATQQDGNLVEVGYFFIKQMVKLRRSGEEIIKLCQRLQNDGMTTRSLSVALQQALLNGSPALIKQILTEFQVQSLQIREHYFWPLLCSEAEKGTDSILNIVTMMQSDFKIMPTMKTIENFIVPKVKPSDYKLLISRLLDMGLPYQNVISATVLACLMSGNLNDAYAIGSYHKAYYNPKLFQKPLIKAIRHDGIDFYVKFVRLICESVEWKVKIEADIEENNKTSSPSDPQKILSNFIDDLFTNIGQMETIESILRALVKEGLAISEKQSETLKSYNYTRLTPKISSLLNSLVKQNSLPLAKQNEKSPTDSLLKLNHLLDGNLEGSIDTAKCQEIFQKLKTEKINIPVSTYVKLLRIYMRQDQLDKAMEIYENIHGQGSLLNKKLTLMLALCLMKVGKFSDAERIIAENAVENSFDCTNHCNQILNYLAESDTPENVEKFFSILKQHKYIIKVKKALLGSLIKVYVNKGDLNTAIDKLIEVSTQYRLTPMVHDILSKLIDANDVDNLLRVMDFLNKSTGENNTDLSLLFAYISCNRLEEARQIAEKHRLRNHSGRIIAQCKYQIRIGRPERLEILLDVTEYSEAIDRNIIFEHLLDFYWKSDSVDKMLGLWHRIKKESFIADDQFLIKLGKHLKRKGVVVPFDIPNTGDTDNEQYQRRKDFKTV